MPTTAAIGAAVATTASAANSMANSGSSPGPAQGFGASPSGTPAAPRGNNVMTPAYNLFSAQDPNTGIVNTALNQNGSLGQSLYGNNWAPLIGQMQNLAPQYGAAAQAYTTNQQAALDAYRNTLAENRGTYNTSLDAYYHNLLSGLNGATSSYVGDLSNATNYLQGGLGAATRGYGQNVGAAVDQFGNAINTATAGYGQGATAATDQFGNAINQATGTYGQNINQATTGYGQNIAGATNTGLGYVGSSLGTQLQGLQGAGDTYNALMSRGYFAPLLQAEAQRSAGLSNLRDTLAHRGVLGSSFANDDLSRANAEYSLNEGLLAQGLAGANYGIQSNLANTQGAAIANAGQQAYGELANQAQGLYGTQSAEAQGLYGTQSAGTQQKYQAGLGLAQGLYQTQATQADQTLAARMAQAQGLYGTQSAEAQNVANAMFNQGQQAYQARTNQANAGFGAGLSTAGAQYQSGVDLQNAAFAGQTGLNQNALANQFTTLDAYKQNITNQVNMIAQAMNVDMTQLGAATGSNQNLLTAMNDYSRSLAQSSAQVQAANAQGQGAFMGLMGAGAFKALGGAAGAGTAANSGGGWLGRQVSNGWDWLTGGPTQPAGAPSTYSPPFTADPSMAAVFA